MFFTLASFQYVPWEGSEHTMAVQKVSRSDLYYKANGQFRITARQKKKCSHIYDYVLTETIVQGRGVILMAPFVKSRLTYYIYTNERIKINHH